MSGDSLDEAGESLRSRRDDDGAKVLDGQARGGLVRVVNGGDASDDGEVPAEFDVVVETIFSVEGLVVENGFLGVSAALLFLHHGVVDRGDVTSDDGSEDVDAVEGSGLSFDSLEGGGVGAVKDGGGGSDTDEGLSGQVSDEDVIGSLHDGGGGAEQVAEGGEILFLGGIIEGHVPVDSDGAALHEVVGVGPSVNPVAVNGGDKLASSTPSIGEGAEGSPDGVRMSDVGDVPVVSLGPLHERVDGAVGRSTVPGVGEVLGDSVGARLGSQISVVRVGVVADISVGSLGDVATAETDRGGARGSGEVVHDADTGERQSDAVSVGRDESVDHGEETSGGVAPVCGATVVGLIARNFQTVVETVDHVVEHVSGELGDDSCGAHVAKGLDHDGVSRSGSLVVGVDGDGGDRDGFDDDQDGVVGEGGVVKLEVDVDDGLRSALGVVASDGHVRANHLSGGLDLSVDEVVLSVDGSGGSHVEEGEVVLPSDAVAEGVEHELASGSPVNGDDGSLVGVLLSDVVASGVEDPVDVKIDGDGDDAVVGGVVGQALSVGDDASVGAGDVVNPGNGRLPSRAAGGSGHVDDELGVCFHLGCGVGVRHQGGGVGVGPVIASTVGGGGHGVEDGHGADGGSGVFDTEITPLAGVSRESVGKVDVLEGANRTESHVAESVEELLRLGEVIRVVENGPRSGGVDESAGLRGQEGLDSAGSGGAGLADGAHETTGSLGADESLRSAGDEQVRVDGDSLVVETVVRPGVGSQIGGAGSEVVGAKLGLNVGGERVDTSVGCGGGDVVDDASVSEGVLDVASDELPAVGGSLKDDTFGEDGAVGDEDALKNIEREVDGGSGDAVSVGVEADRNGEGDEVEGLVDVRVEIEVREEELTLGVGLGERLDGLSVEFRVSP